MAVLHIYTKNGKIYCTAKEPFLGKEKPLPNLPAFSELFSSGVTCVVFKLPSLLKTRNFKLILSSRTYSMHTGYSTPAAL